MIIQFRKTVEINTKYDIDKLRFILGVNKMKLDNINISEIAREANVSWDTANRRLRGINKGYPTTKY